MTEKIKIEIKNKYHVEYEELTGQLSFEFEVDTVEKEETVENSLVPEMVIQIPKDIKNQKDLMKYCWNVKSSMYRTLKQYYGF